LRTWIDRIVDNSSDGLDGRNAPATTIPAIPKRRNIPLGSSRRFLAIFTIALLNIQWITIRSDGKKMEWIWVENSLEPR
jgi:hypothetical protein